MASKIEKVQKIKEEGNDFFKQANYKKATRFYNRALSHFNGLREEETEAVVNLKVSLYLNLAFCNLKLDEISKAIKNSEKVSTYFSSIFLFYFSQLFMETLRRLNSKVIMPKLTID